ncbi:hypothetical protein [Azospirillum sp. TSO5]|uniref:hypothetical protein n=1 Tax=Azospirillum sp. TSO5 TaxID=716760 RepID=UPI0011B1F08D|nr:hypothetical protein [Azospirillum sp. TSO5]
MVGLVALFDRDVFLKLAACDLFDDVVTAFGVAEAYRLPSASRAGARTMLRRWRPGDAVRDAFLARVEMLQRRVEVIPEDWVTDCQKEPLFNAMIGADTNIDAGEAYLSIITLKREDPNLLISGDKRFIEGMAALFPTDFAALRPSLVCFEDCLKAVVEMQGLDELRPRLTLAMECDGTLKVALGRDGTVTQERFLEALQGFHPLRAQFA